MSSPQPLSETIIVKVKDGVNLKNAGPASSEPAVQKFLEIINLTRSQPGATSQFYGHMVEHPEYFVLVYSWESADHHATYLKSTDHQTILANLSHVFDTKAFHPFFVYYPFNPAATAAYKSAVTEVAFFTLPTASMEDSKLKIESGLTGADGPNVMELVVSVGKATGAATGWVTSTRPPSALPSGTSVALYGFFGYESIDAHMAWRETPEHAKVVEYQTKQFEGLGLEATVVSGLDLSMFHVEFEEGK